MARRETETLGESTAGAGAARRSPPTERVVQVLDHLVARPGVRFGLSELARELDLSKPPAWASSPCSPTPAIWSVIPSTRPTGSARR